MHYRDLRAEAIENSRKFEPDIAATYHDRPRRKLRKEEGLVRGDRQFTARNGRRGGPASSCDQDVARGETLAADHDRMSVGDGCARAQNSNPIVGEELLIDAIEACDLAVLVDDQRAPV